MDKKYTIKEKVRNKSKDHQGSTDKTQIYSIERYLVQKPARESKPRDSPRDESAEACTSRSPSVERKGKREKESEVRTKDTKEFKSKVSSEDKPKPNKIHVKSRHRAEKKKDSKSSKKTDHSKTNNNTLKDFITINPSPNKSSHDKTKDSKSGSSTKSKNESKSKESMKSKNRGESSSSRKSKDEKTCEVSSSSKSTVKKRPSDPDQEQENENNDKKRKTKSFSLNKHGVRIPTTEDILKEREDIARNMKLIEDLDNLPTIPADFLSKLNEFIDEEEMEIHDCKHLTPEQLETYFIKYQSYLEDIITGKENCERHQRFYDRKLKRNGPEFNNISIIAYDFHQMHHLLKLMEKKCSIKDDIYIFHVLLPELCLKIFMDVHQMSLQQATQYLRKCPIE